MDLAFGSFTQVYFAGVKLLEKQSAKTSRDQPAPLKIISARLSLMGSI